MNELVSSKTIFLSTKKDGEREMHLFSVIDGTSANAEIASAIAIGHPMKKCPLKDLPIESVATIVSYFQVITTFFDKRKMLVVDLGSFPLIVAYIDERDPNKQYANTTAKFPTDVKNTYNSYDIKTQIPLIIVNLDVPFTGLKLIPIHTAEELAE